MGLWATPVSVSVGSERSPRTERSGVAHPRLTIGQDLTAYVASVYEEHHHALKRYLVLTGSAPEAVEDLVQQSFVRLIQTLNEGVSVGQPKSWLLRVVHNIRIDDYRRRKREIALEDLQPVDALERLFAVEPDPEAGLLHQEQYRRFQACLRRLTPKQCHYLVLRIEGLKLREIAEMFGVTVQTVSETCAKALLEFGELRDEE